MMTTTTTTAEKITSKNNNKGNTMKMDIELHNVCKNIYKQKVILE